MPKLLRLIPVLFALAFMPGCAAFTKALPQIVSLVTDAVLVIEQIESFSQSYFRAHPDAKHEAEVTDALSRARSTLIATERAASGADALAKEDSAAALAAFKEAYAQLLVAVSGMPGLHVTKGGEDAAGGPGELTVPETLLLVQQLER